MLDRAQIEKIQNANKRRAVLIQGARKTGKLSILKKLIEDRECIWIKGDDPSDVKKLISACENREWSSLLTASNLAIDQAQNIEGIGPIVRDIVDKNETTRIYVTSSSAINLDESAAGRVESFQLWPLSVTELAKEIGWTSLEQGLNSRVVFGMYPQAALSNQPQMFLDDYSISTMLRDIYASGIVRNPLKLSSLLNLLAQSIGSEVNYDTLSKEAGISKATLLGYLELLEKCFIIKRCDSYANNLEGELKKGKKIYFCDTGVRNALLKDFSPLSTRKDAEALWENFIFMELVKKISNEGSGQEVGFWRTRESGGVKPREVDFVCVKDNRPVSAYNCSLTVKPKDKAAKVFSEAYPGCPVKTVTPNELRETFSTWQRISIG